MLRIALSRPRYLLIALTSLVHLDAKYVFIKFVNQLPGCMNMLDLQLACVVQQNNAA